MLKTEINRYLENVKDEIKKKKQQDNKKIIKIVTMCSTALITVLLAVFVITPSIKFSAEIKKIADSNIGDTVSFGKYPQSNANKKEPVEWVILDKQGDKYLLMTINGLDSVEYKKYAGYWSDSNLRNWLNNDFYNSAFSDKEKSLISMTTISDDKQGGASQDYVFALSVQEFKQYNAPEKVKITEYADSHSAYSVSENNRGMFSYWLRTVLSSSTPTSVATSTNIVNGDITNNKNVLVAPVIWVNIK